MNELFYELGYIGSLRFSKTARTASASSDEIDSSDEPSGLFDGGDTIGRVGRGLFRG